MASNILNNLLTADKSPPEPIVVKKANGLHFDGISIFVKGLKQKTDDSLIAWSELLHVIALS